MLMMMMMMMMLLMMMMMMVLIRLVGDVEVEGSDGNSLKKDSVTSVEPKDKIVRLVSFKRTVSKEEADQYTRLGLRYTSVTGRSASPLDKPTSGQRLRDRNMYLFADFRAAAIIFSANCSLMSAVSSGLHIAPDPSSHLSDPVCLQLVPRPKQPHPTPASHCAEEQPIIPSYACHVHARGNQTRAAAIVDTCAQGERRSRLRLARVLRKDMMPEPPVPLCSNAMGALLIISPSDSCLWLLSVLSCRAWAAGTVMKRLTTLMW
ncbi:hypothetical protein EYF80_015543 [Liparis tanakae]|uniref:Uncharacterized protein n=1 Tax=Liparis tanakae TaxID=230148 RepID=A0A4Z2I8V5_9TELE|nr:hypothetical protein EYF80_015543 [Liparis tanakae]